MRNIKHLNRKLSNQSGFTLLELVIVLGILAYTFTLIVNRGNNAEIKSDTQNIVSFLKDAKVDLRQVVPEEVADCTTANITAGAFVEAYKVEVTSGGTTSTLIKPDKRSTVDFAPNAGNTACVITMANVQEDRCNIYVKELWPSNENLTVNATEVKADDTVTYTSASTAIRTACGNATNTISTEFSG